tara:strand:+ start:945 stop:1166 length:222 start_codon:yes stop_codon:yes gene_type:complete
MKSKLEQTIENLEVCIDFLGLDNERTGEMLAATEELGLNVEYFCHEFMETSSIELHNPDYLNIAEFNAMFWEF